MFTIPLKSRYKDTSYTLKNTEKLVENSQKANETEKNQDEKNTAET